MVKLVNVPVGKPANEHETAPRVNALLKDSIPLTKPIGYNATTLYEFVDESLGKHSSDNIMGSRDLLDIHEKKKMVTKFINGKETQVEKTWLYYELSSYKYITKSQLKTLFHNYGKGLVSIGLKPGNEEKMHIFASTSAKWLQTFLAATSQAIPIVTAYDTLGEAGLTYSILQTETSAIYTDNSLLCKLINPLKKTDKIKYIIHSEKIDENDKRDQGRIFKEANDAKLAILKERPDIKFYSFDEVVELGRAAGDKIASYPPKPEDIACIMYTSGSTGDPKGVVLTHENILAGIAGVGGVIDTNIVHRHDRIICFLPLAHIFEMAFELLIFYWGGVIGYAGVKTLTDNSMYDGCRGDMIEFKPNIMVAVAAVWETIKKGIIAKIGLMPSMVQKVFWSAYKSKQFMTNYHIPGSSILDALLFKKIKEATGGELRYVLNGGSPISVDTQEFITTLIAPMLIGYGLTETVANTSLLRPEHYKPGVAGMITSAIQIKLVDVEDLGYFAKNNQGEIWIKGKPVMKEYFKNEKETKNTITEDGWFKTGDIGEWTSDNGQLKVIDRKKNLVKTLNGEYIALEKLESIYRSNTIVLNICCYADVTKVKPIAIVSPNVEKLEKLAIDEGIIKSPAEFELSDIVKNEKLSNIVAKQLITQAKKDGLNGIELILGVVLVDKEWTPQNGYVTSAHKLQRKKILADVQDRVDALYKANS